MRSTLGVTQIWYMFPKNILDYIQKTPIIQQSKAYKHTAFSIFATSYQIKPFAPLDEPLFNKSFLLCLKFHTKHFLLPYKCYKLLIILP